MAEWSDGYVTNIEYTSGFYPGLSPLAQNFALLFRGVEPVPLADGFAYCELGCGHGFTTAILAAANPKGSFWGIDFNPTHIASAEQLARAAAIGNVTFVEQSFAEALRSDLPRFDFISLHGIWSWVSRSNRQAIVDLIYARLKPGGVVYISYNAMPGWAQNSPLRQLFVEWLRGQGEVTAERVNGALAFAEKVRKTGAAYFELNPQSGKRLEAIANMSRNYVAHEYFNREWSPSYHSDVAADLAAAKLSFAAPSLISEHLDFLMMKPEALELLKEVSDPTAKETVRDYFVNQQFRRDLFTRGARQLSQRERNERLLATRLALRVPPPSLPTKARFPLGEVTLEPGQYQPILDALAAGPLTFRELLAKRSNGGAGEKAAFQAVMLLIAASLVAPALDAEDEQARRISTDRFNRAMVARSGPGRQEQTLASPVLGTGVAVPLIEQLFLAIEREKASNPIDAALRVMAERGQQVLKQGKPVASAAEARSELEKASSEFRQKRLPVYRQLGLT
jgi:SAM-dependent methyltransferase